MNQSLILENLAATEALGRRLGRLLFPGAVVALIGPLGAGKTHLVRAIAEGLEIENAAAVTSPTFVLIQEYAARLPIYHFDAYRLKGEREFEDLGSGEYFAGRGVCLVEWGDRVPGSLPPHHLRIALEAIDDSRRKIVLESYGKEYEDLLAELEQFQFPSCRVGTSHHAPGMS